MATVEAIETDTVEMEAMQKLYPARSGIDDPTLCFRDFKEREGGPAAIKPVTCECQCSFRTG